MNDDLNHWRNRIAVPLANWVLRYIATPAYSARVDVLMRVGIGSLYGVHERRPQEEGHHPQCYPNCRRCAAEALSAVLRGDDR